MSTPQSTIYLCSGVRINARYEHTLYFPSEAAQESYFMGKVVKHFTAYSYIRKSWDIKVQATMEEAKTWNYLFFRNGTAAKVYYYFINNIEYVNDSTVELTLELDVMQTYLFDIELLPCFVEREHSKTDVIGEHLLDEGLDLGEIHTDGERYDVDELKDLCILVQSTINVILTTEDQRIDLLGSMYNDVFSGMAIYAIEATDYIAWGQKLDELAGWGYLDGIVNMWMYPKALVTLGDAYSWGDGNTVKVVKAAQSFLWEEVTKPTDINGYIPKNKKLFTYPYNFLYLTNNMGSACVYHYEKFGTAASVCYFRIGGAIAPDGCARITPVVYDHVALYHDEGMTLGGFPTCAWNADTYKIWLAQNQNTQNLGFAISGVKIAVGAVGAVASAATGNLLGAGASIGSIASGAADIAGTLAARADKEIQPPQSRGQASSSVNIVEGAHTFSFYKKSISATQAEILDDYFTMYGYKCNRVKIPNISSRPVFNYVKTIGCHIAGNLCNEDLLKIESIFDRGVTFWRSGDDVGDYTGTDNRP